MAIYEPLPRHAPSLGKGVTKTALLVIMHTRNSLEMELIKTFMNDDAQNVFKDIRLSPSGNSFFFKFMIYFQ